jgi:hypothetical protein
MSLDECSRVAGSDQFHKERALALIEVCGRFEGWWRTVNTECDKARRLPTAVAHALASIIFRHLALDFDLIAMAPCKSLRHRHFLQVL